MSGEASQEGSCDSVNQKSSVINPGTAIRNFHVDDLIDAPWANGAECLPIEGVTVTQTVRTSDPGGTAILMIAV